MKATREKKKTRITKRNTIHTDSLVLRIPYCPAFATRPNLRRAELYTLHPPGWQQEECSIRAARLALLW